MILQESGIVVQCCCSLLLCVSCEQENIDIKDIKMDIRKQKYYSQHNDLQMCRNRKKLLLLFITCLVLI